MKRGFTSLHGVTTVITWPTGQMVDFEVMSRFCSQCSQKRATLEANKITQAEFNIWSQKHQYDVTTTISAGSMEVQGALAEWCRSGTSRGLRFTTFIGDRDCKVHQAIQEAKLYSPVPVVKEECVGHFQKSRDALLCPEEKARDKEAKSWEANW